MNGIDLLDLAESESEICYPKNILYERVAFEKGFIKGYQKAQQEAKIIEGMKMDEEQANKGVCKDCYYAGSFTCEH